MSIEEPYHKFLINNPYPRELKYYDHLDLINFSSNDYLGLAKHPYLISRAHEFSKQHGVGSSSSRLVSGNFSIYEKLEQQIAQGVNKPSALIIGTGFQTNFSILATLMNSTILGSIPRVFCDRLCHASMQLSAHQFADINRFHHNDLDHLQKLLEKFSDCKRPKFILAESIYSMDGDRADLPGLIKLAKLHNAFLYIDDAHSVGMYGSKSWGMAGEFANDIDVIMGSFSKGLGSFGGYVACSELLKKFLVNQCKGLIYSTGLPPMVLGAISAAIELLPSLNRERQRVLAYAEQLRSFLDQNQLFYGGSSTHIVPWIIGDAQKTLKASLLLLKEGILGLPIRPPSVPQRQCRIRFCLSASHSSADIQKLLNAIQKVEQKL